MQTKTEKGPDSETEQKPILDQIVLRQRNFTIQAVQAMKLSEISKIFIERISVRKYDLFGAIY